MQEVASEGPTPAQRGGVGRSRALIVASVNVLLFGGVILLSFLGYGPPEPWDLLVFVIVAILCPIGGGFVTLSYAFREIRAGQPKWKPLLAIGLSLSVFLVGLSFLVIRG
jgi:hypothetical protein